MNAKYGNEWRSIATLTVPIPHYNWLQIAIYFNDLYVYVATLYVQGIVMASYHVFKDVGTLWKYHQTYLI